MVFYLRQGNYVGINRYYDVNNGKEPLEKNLTLKMWN